MAKVRVREVVRTRRLEVLDADDVPRCIIQCSRGAEDAVIFELVGPKKRHSIVFVVMQDAASAQLWFAGNNVIALNMDDKGRLNALDDRGV